MADKNIIRDPRKIRQAKIQKKVASKRDKSRIAKFNKDAMPAIIQAMSEVFAKYYAKLKQPIHTDPDRSLLKEEYYRLLRCCPAYSRSKAKARAKLSGLTYHFAAKNYSHSDWVAIFEQIFEGIKNFSEARARLGDALFEGRTWLKIIWTTKSILVPSTNQILKLKVPDELQFQIKELFQFQTTQVGAHAIMGQWTVGNLATGMREALTDWEAYNYMTSAYFPELRNMFYGEGIDSYAISIIQAIQILVNYALKYAERKAEVHVFIKSKFANLVSSDLQSYMDNASDMSIQRLKNLIEYFVAGKNKGALLLGPDDDAGILDTAGRSDNIYLSLLNYLDKELETWILGCLGGLDEEGGSRAKAETGRQEQNDFLAWNQKLLIEEPIQELMQKIVFAFDYAVDEEGRTLLDGNNNPIPIHDNYKEFAKTHLLNYKIPTFQLGEVGKEEPRDVLPIYQFLSQIPGLGFKTDELYERLGVTKPENVKDEIIIPEQPMMQQGRLSQFPSNLFGSGTVQDEGEKALFNETNQSQINQTAAFRESKISKESKTTKIETQINPILKESKELLKLLIYTKANTPIKNRINEKLDKKIKHMIAQLYILSSIIGANNLIKELSDYHTITPVLFAENEPIIRNIDEVKHIPPDILRKRIEQGWNYLGISEQLDNFNTQFQQAIDAVLRANPILAQTAEELRQRYEQGNIESLPVISAVAADTVEQVMELQRRMTEWLETGKREGVEDDIVNILNSTGSYAENVFRTVTATAYSIGRQIQQKPLEDNGFIVGYELLTANDGRVRGRPDGLYPDAEENHWAFHKLRLRADNELWDGLTPPLGYQCRCIKRAITRIEAQQKGWLDDDGKLIEYYPPTYQQGKIQEGFGRKYHV